MQSLHRFTWNFSLRGCTKNQTAARNVKFVLVKLSNFHRASFSVICAVDFVLLQLIELDFSFNGVYRKCAICPTLTHFNSYPVR